MATSMLVGTIAVPAASTESPNFDRGRELLKEVEDPSLYTFDDPEGDLKELLPDLSVEPDLVDKDGEVPIGYARRAGLAIIDNLEEALDSHETTLLTVADYWIYLSGGLSHGGTPTTATKAIWDAHKLPESVLFAMGFTPDYELSLSRANSHGVSTSLTDTDVVDAIALRLGTSPEWSGDTLTWIADTIGKVRKHPGGRDPREYRLQFAEEHAFDPREDSFLAQYINEGADDEADHAHP
ncbi:hypothetical protein ACIQVR_27325 [Streptomyces xanthochromogenes]|uniref:hypothetical protein n=1 Tax=Streptomyces xanthochromogenes TaxID=67384 RepID=UPI00381E278C